MRWSLWFGYLLDLSLLIILSETGGQLVFVSTIAAGIVAANMYQFETTPAEFTIVACGVNHGNETMTSWPYTLEEEASAMSLAQCPNFTNSGNDIDALIEVDSMPRTADGEECAQGLASSYRHARYGICELDALSSWTRYIVMGVILFAFYEVALLAPRAGIKTRLLAMATGKLQTPRPARRTAKMVTMMMFPIAFAAYYVLNSVRECRQQMCGVEMLMTSEVAIEVSLLNGVILVGPAWNLFNTWAVEYGFIDVDYLLKGDLQREGYETVQVYKDFAERPQVTKARALAALNAFWAHFADVAEAIANGESDPRTGQTLVAPMIPKAPNAETSKPDDGADGDIPGIMVSRATMDGDADEAAAAAAAAKTASAPRRGSRTERRLSNVERRKAEKEAAEKEAAEKEEGEEGEKEGSDEKEGEETKTGKKVRKGSVGRKRSTSKLKKSRKKSSSGQK